MVPFGRDGLGESNNFVWKTILYLDQHSDFIWTISKWFLKRQEGKKSQSLVVSTSVKCMLA